MYTLTGALRRHRGTLTVLVSAAMIVAGAVAVATLYRPLPLPEQANRDQLLRWLVLRDLSRESEETRAVLVRRLDQEFATGEIDFAATGEKLSLEHRQRLWRNVELLMEPWFFDKLEGYLATENEQRVAYLDHLIDTIDHWRKIEILRPGATPGADDESLASVGATKGFVPTFFAQVHKWQQQTTPARRQQAAEFLMALQVRWFMRSLGATTPASD